MRKRICRKDKNLPRFVPHRPSRNGKVKSFRNSVGALLAAPSCLAPYLPVPGGSARSDGVGFLENNHDRH